MTARRQRSRRLARRRQPTDTGTCATEAPSGAASISSWAGLGIYAQLSGERLTCAARSVSSPVAACIKDAAGIGRAKRSAYSREQGLPVPPSPDL
jgi:hypothetical protein